MEHSIERMPQAEAEAGRLTVVYLSGAVWHNRSMRCKAAGIAARAAFGLSVFALLAVVLTTRHPKSFNDFDQPFYITIAYDVDRHGVFSNGFWDDVDSTVTMPAPGMFFAPLYPLLIVAVAKADPRFAASMLCGIEVIHGKRDGSGCDYYAGSILVLHALFLAIGVVAIALTAEAIIGHGSAFWIAGILATAGLAEYWELFSFIMTESLTFGLFAVSAWMLVLGLKAGRRRYFILSGVFIGLVSLTRFSFLVAAPAMATLIVIAPYALGTFGRRQAWIHALTFGACILVLIAPWIARNYISVGKLALSEEYASAALVERFAYNRMTVSEFLLAIPYCIPRIGLPAVQAVFGKDAMARFEWNADNSFFWVGRKRRLSLIAEHGRLDPIIRGVIVEEMRENWWRYLLVSLPLGWCGILVGGVLSIVLLPLFTWAFIDAIRQSKPLFVLYALPALLMLALHAVLAAPYTRYNLSLLGPFVVGAAWIACRKWLPLVARMRTLR